MSSGKAELRAHLKNQRLAESDASRKSALIAAHLRDILDWSSIQKVHVYQSNLAWNEVDTKPIIDYIRHTWPEKRVVIPAVKPGLKIPDESFDLIIVPCLGFDKDLYRLGMGGGYYDRFLARQPQALKIGLAFQNALADKGLPHDQHDIPLDQIVSEAKVFSAT